MSGDQLSPAARAAKFGAARREGIVRCDACPVLCRIRPGRAGACARYANDAGQLVRTDPVVLMARTIDANGKLAAFAGQRLGWRAARSDAHLPHRHRRRHDLSRLQAGALHRLGGARRRRHRHGGHRGHFQLLRRQGED
mgnify:CR=1 FL=1